MPDLKHIGRIKNNKRRVIVAYRTIPNDPYNALVVLTESLPADEHDSLIKLVESPAGQEAYELAEAMSRTYLPDGRNMLSGFHTTGQLKKVKTSDIEMIPNSTASISLDKLNELIAQQRGVALEDLSVKPNYKSEPTQETKVPVNISNDIPLETTVSNDNESKSPEEQASKMRSLADAMFKEAKKLRELAEGLHPTRRRKI